MATIPDPRDIIDLTAEKPHTKQPKKRKAGSASYDLPPKMTDPMDGPTGCATSAVDFFFPVGLPGPTNNPVFDWNREFRKHLEKQEVIVFLLFLLQNNVTFSLIKFADLVEHERPRKVLAELALRNPWIGRLHSKFFRMKLEDQAITEWQDMTEVQLKKAFWKLLTLQESTFGFHRADLTKLVNSQAHIKVVYYALMRLSPEDEGGESGDDDDDQPSAEKRTKAQDHDSDHEAVIAVE